MTGIKKKKNYDRTCSRIHLSLSAGERGRSMSVTGLCTSLGIYCVRFSSSCSFFWFSCRLSTTLLEGYFGIDYIY